jgi:hypothetical protein
LHKAHPGNAYHTLNRALLSMLVFDPDAMAALQECNMHVCVTIPEEEIPNFGEGIFVARYATVSKKGKTPSTLTPSNVLYATDSSGDGLVKATARGRKALECYKTNKTRYALPIITRQGFPQYGFANLHPIELLARVHGFQITMAIANTAKALYGGMLFVSDAELMQEWEDLQSSIYGDNAYLSHVVWTDAEEYYDRSQIGPLRAEPTERASSSREATVLNDSGGEGIDTGSDTGSDAGLDAKTNAGIEAKPTMQPHSSRLPNRHEPFPSPTTRRAPEDKTINGLMQGRMLDPVLDPMQRLLPSATLQSTTARRFPELF